MWSPARFCSEYDQLTGLPVSRSQAAIASSIEQFERRPPPILYTAHDRGLMNHLPECVDEIIGMHVIAHLLSLITEHGVAVAGDRTFG